MENIDWSQYYLHSVAGVELVDNSLVNTNKVILGKTIFYTITPCDEYLEVLNCMINNMNETTAIEKLFALDILDHFRKVRKYLRKKLGIYADVYMYFEKGTNGRIHSHGVIHNIPNTYHPYNWILKKLSVLSHKVFGRSHCRTEIAALYKWCEDTWDGSYLTKQNILRPMSLTYK